MEIMNLIFGQCSISVNNVNTNEISTTFLFAKISSFGIYAVEFLKLIYFSRSDSFCRGESYINDITKKANSILGLLWQKHRIPSQTIKTYAYQTMIRPHLECTKHVIVVNESTTTNLHT